MSTKCGTKFSPDWYCSREAGHEGSCAAWPVSHRAAGGTSTIRVTHGNVTHGLNHHCGVCEQARQEFEEAVKSGEIDEILEGADGGSD